MAKFDGTSDYDVMNDSDLAHEMALSDYLDNILESEKSEQQRNQEKADEELARSLFMADTGNFKVVKVEKYSDGNHRICDKDNTLTEAESAAIAKAIRGFEKDEKLRDQEKPEDKEVDNNGLKFYTVKRYTDGQRDKDNTLTEAESAAIAKAIRVFEKLKEEKETTNEPDEKIREYRVYVDPTYHPTMANIEILYKFVQNVLKVESYPEFREIGSFEMVVWAMYEELYRNKKLLKSWSQFRTEIGKDNCSVDPLNRFKNILKQQIVKIAYYVLRLEIEMDDLLTCEQKDRLHIELSANTKESMFNSDFQKTIGLMEDYKVDFAERLLASRYGICLIMGFLRYLRDINGRYAIESMRSVQKWYTLNCNEEQKLRFEYMLEEIGCLLATGCRPGIVKLVDGELIRV